MPFNDTKYPIRQDLAPTPSRRRPGRMIGTIHFVVAHDTGNPGAPASNHARWYQNDPNPPRNLITSAHLFVDDKEIVETIPALTGQPEEALHVLYGVPTDNRLYGHDANRAAIGIEYCYGGDIDADEAYERFVWTIACACHKFGLDPARRVTGHHVLDPARKSDPKQGLGRSGRTFDGLLRDVVDEYNASGGDRAGSEAAVQGKARTTVWLHRRSQPNRGGASRGTLAPGTEVTVRTVVAGERVAGIADWAEIGAGEYCWSGGLVAA